MPLPNKGRLTSITRNGQSIGGVREKSVALNGEPIDISSDDDTGKRLLLASESAEDQVDITVNGISKNQNLRKDWFQGNRQRSVVITFADGATLTGTFHLSAYSEGHPYKEASTFEATLLSTGAFVYVPAV